MTDEGELIEEDVVRRLFDMPCRITGRVATIDPPRLEGPLATREQAVTDALKRQNAIVTEVRRILQTPEVVTQVLAVLKRDQVSETEAIAALHDFNTLWAQLFPLEQARIIQLLVRRVTVTAAGLEVDIRREGVAGVIREMIAPRDMEAAE